MKKKVTFILNFKLYNYYKYKIINGYEKDKNNKKRILHYRNYK